MAIADSKSNNPQTPAERKALDVLWEKLELEKEKTSEAILLNEALIESIGEGVIIVNEYGDITQVNQVALSLLGYKRNELQGAWLPRVLPSRDKKGKDIPTSERAV